MPVYQRARVQAITAEAARRASPPAARDEEAMISCPTCGTSNRPGSLFCNGCGRRVDVVACPSCGKDNPGDSRFCAVCGARLTREGGEALGAATPGRDPVSLPSSEPAS